MLTDDLEPDEDAMRQAEHAKVARTLNDLYGYLEANRDLIVDYGDRRRHGESISSSLAESSINQIVAKRFVKKQQMRWQPESAHLLLQIRTKTLNGELRETFRHWYSAMTATSAPALR